MDDQRHSWQRLTNRNNEPIVTIRQQAISFFVSSTPSRRLTADGVISDAEKNVTPGQKVGLALDSFTKDVF
jgi:hypothetical protein